MVFVRCSLETGDTFGVGITPARKGKDKTCPEILVEQRASEFLMLWASIVSRMLVGIARGANKKRLLGSFFREADFPN